MQNSAVTKDSFPRGTKLPEGVACDSVRAIIHCDTTLLVETCLPPQSYRESRVQKSVALYLKKTVERMKQEAKNSVPSPMGAKAILKVYSPQSLSRNGMELFGYGLVSFKDIRFVDVQVLTHSGKKPIGRTLVVQRADLSWCVDLLPCLSPELYIWLKEEKPSLPLYDQAPRNH